jgi:hypothetical protein
MTRKVQLGLLVVIVIAAHGLAGCEAGAPLQMPSSSPSSPSDFVPYVTIQPTPVVFAPNVTLSGVVFEVAQGAEVPIEGVGVYCEACGEETHTWASTDKKGFYSFKGVWGTPVSILVGKDGYQDPPGTMNSPLFGPGWRDVVINGDTRFNIQLARK